MTRIAKLIEPSRYGKLPEISAKELQPRSDLTFKVFNNLTLEGVTIHQSLLNGSLFRDCAFVKCRFSRCDLEQVQIQSCKFIDVDFSNIELSSAQIARCQFQNCDFESAMLSDCVWSDCALENCSFQQAAIHSSRFSNCRFVDDSFLGASLQLDTFQSCSFEDVKLGDCTFLNHIMAECSYTNVHINAESIGSLFGISERDLASCKLVYLGQNVVDVLGSGGLLDRLENDYEQRRWFFMKEMLRLNFRRAPRLVALDCCLEAVLWPSSVGVPLKTSDIAFLEMVVMELFRQQELPALVSLTFPEKIKQFVQQRQDGSADPYTQLHQLGGRLRSLFLELLQQLAKYLEHWSLKDRLIDVTLTFDEKPQTDAIKFIRSVTSKAGLDICGPTKKLQEQPGSYLLFLQTTLVTLAGFQIALWLLNGCVAQVIELKARFQIASQKNSPKVIRNRMLLPDQTVPKWMTAAIPGILSKLTANPAQLHQVASDFSPANLKKIDINGRSSRKAGSTSRRKV